MNGKDWEIHYILVVEKLVKNTWYVRLKWNGLSRSGAAKSCAFTWFFFFFNYFWGFSNSYYFGLSHPETHLSNQVTKFFIVLERSCYRLHEA